MGVAAKHAARGFCDGRARIGEMRAHTRWQRLSVYTELFRRTLGQWNRSYPRSQPSVGHEGRPNRTHTYERQRAMARLTSTEAWDGEKSIDMALQKLEGPMKYLLAGK